MSHRDLNERNTNWTETARLTREVAAGLARLKAGAALTSAGWMASQLDPITHLISVGRVVAASRAPDHSPFDLADPEPTSGPEARSLPWIVAACKRKGSRPLNRSEWAVLANDAEGLHDRLVALADAFEQEDAKLAGRWRQADEMLRGWWRKLIEVAEAPVEEAPEPSSAKHKARAKPAGDFTPFGRRKRAAR